MHLSAGLGNRSFFAKKWANERFAQKKERFAHLLIFGERPEQFAHGRSFMLSDLSDSLTSLIFGDAVVKNTIKPQELTNWASNKNS